MSALDLWKWTRHQCCVASEAPFRLVTRLRHGMPDLMLYFGRSPGDDLLCTGLLRELSIRGQRNIWMMSNHPDLFVANPDIQHVLPVEGRCERFAHKWRLNYRYLEYAKYEPAHDRTTSPERHAIAELCLRMGLDGTVALRPFLHLSSDEAESAQWASGKICIQSSGLAARVPMANKQWYPERFQETVNALRNTVEFIQIGSPSDPKLDGTIDCRGKLLRRETAAVLASSQLFVGTVGFLMHLARAVECPSVIVYGGREAPWQSGYGANTNLYSAEPCSPCWRINGCDFDRVCMSRISTAEVVAAIRTRLCGPRQALPIDHVVLPSVPWRDETPKTVSSEN